MATAELELPEGFVEDAPSPPDGFVEDAPKPPGGFIEDQPPVSAERRADIDKFVGGRGPQTATDSWWEAANKTPDIIKNNSVLDWLEQQTGAYGAFGETGHDIGVGINKGVRHLVEGLVTPLGLSTLGIGAAPKAIQTVVAGAFAAHIAKHLPDTVAAIGNAKTVEERATAITEAIGSGAMLAGIGKHLAGRPPEGGIIKGESRTEVDALDRMSQSGAPAPETPPSTPEQAIATAQSDALASPEPATPQGIGKITQLLEQRQKVTDPEERQRLWDEAHGLLKTEQSEPPQEMLQGPGKMTVGELPPQKTTGLKKSVVKDERIQRGLDDLPPTERQSEEARVDAAEAKVDADPTIAPSIVERIVDKGDHAVSPDDAAVLLVERTRLMNEREMWEDRMAAGDEVDVAPVKLQQIEDQLHRLDTAQRAAGKSWGQVGNLYQRMMKADFSLESMIRKVSAAKGRPLDADTEIPKIKEQAARIADLEKEVAGKTEAERTAAEATETSRIHEATIKELQGVQKFGKEVFAAAHRIVDRWKTEATESQKALRQAMAQTNVGLDPTLVLHAAKVIRAKIGEFGLDKAESFTQMVAEYGEGIRPMLEDAWKKAHQLITKEGAPQKVRDATANGVKSKAEKTPVDITTRAKAEAIAGEELSDKTVYDLARAHINAGVHGEDAVMAAVHNDLKDLYPGLTERDVRRAFLEYGKAKFPSKEADKVELAELRTLIRLPESIDRETEGLSALKTGLQRDKATQAIREKQRQLNELLKKRDGPPSPEQLATRDEAKKTALRNAIADLDKELQTGEKPTKSTPAPDSPEVERLRAERDAMKVKLTEMEEVENPGPTPADKQIEALTKIKSRLDETMQGTRTSTPTKAFEALSGKAEDIQAEIDAMRQLVKELRDESKPKPDVDKRREEAQIKALEAAIERYSKKTADSDFEGTGKRLGPDSKKVTQLKEIRDSRKSMYEASKNLAKPIKTEAEKYNERRSKDIERRITELQSRISRNDYAPKPKPVMPELTKANVDAQARLQRLKLDFQRRVEKSLLAKRTPSQKFWDAFVNIQRAMKLTSDVVLAKLSLAAVAREGILTPIEEGLGGAISKALPGLAERAPREGGLSLRSEMKAKAETFTAGMKDAWDNLRFRESNLEVLHGKPRITPPAWWDYMGFLHAALKAPVKRAEFARSLAKRMEYESRQGVDVNDPQVMTRLSQEAYLDGQRSIFMQDNVVSEGFNAMLGRMEASKSAPNLGPALSRIARFLIPIVKVPTNIVGEIGVGVGGLPVGAARAARAYIKGISELEPVQADAILRQLKKGSVGASLILFGYFAYDKIGGFYQEGEKRKESDVPVGRYRIGGVDMPNSFSHSTGAMLLNIGASIRRGQERKGTATGLHVAASGVVEQLPFIPAVTGIVDATHDGGGFERWINGIVSSTTTPALLSHLAKVADTSGTFPQNILQPTVKRKPQTTFQAVKMGIPGLRQQVPEKKK